MSRTTLRGLRPLAPLFSSAEGAPLPLPPRLRRLYGPLRFPQRRGGPHVFANFASTLDGVVAFEGSRSGGSEVGGFNDQDRMVMGILRSVADVVVIGAGTMRAVPRHIWTPGSLFPGLTEEFSELRRRMHLPALPRLVVVSGQGELDLNLPTFQTGAQEVLVATTSRGARRLRARPLPARVKVWDGGEGPRLQARAVLRAARRGGATQRVLVEGGPDLLGTLLSAGALDELFLTLAPQVAGRDGAHRRRALVEGTLFGPSRPLWGSLVDARRAGDHLMLRYRFPRGRPKLLR